MATGRPIGVARRRPSAPALSHRLSPRPDEDWLAALRGEHAQSEELVLALRGYVRRALATTLRRRRLSEEELDDLTQEAFSALLDHLHTFRGDAALPTWAVAVATRVAFTELRRRAARAEHHASFEAACRDALEAGEERPDFGAAEDRAALLEALGRAIDTELTDRQRVATLVLLRGVPTIEIAERTDSNQNAVYKLVHDARLRLRAALEREGITAEDLGWGPEGASG